MISEGELNEALRECMNSSVSYANCEKIAHLLVIKELYYGAGRRAPDEETPQTERKTGFAKTSEFLKLIRGLDVETVYVVMDELVTDTIKIINPQLYNAVMAKLEKKK